MAENLLDKDFLVINGDTYLDIDYQKVYDLFIDMGKESLVVACPSKNEDSSNLKIGKDCLVTKYDREAVGLGYVDAGVLLLKRIVINEIEPGHQVSMENELFPLLEKKGRCSLLLLNKNIMI